MAPTSVGRFRLQAGRVAEMLFEPFEKLRPRIGVALSTEVLERIGGGNAANLRADAIARAAGQALQETASKRVTNPRGIDNLVRGHSGDIRLRMPFDD